jgi:hypothetical protein
MPALQIGTACSNLSRWSVSMSRGRSTKRGIARFQNAFATAIQESSNINNIIALCNFSKRIKPEKSPKIGHEKPWHETCLWAGR